MKHDAFASSLGKPAPVFADLFGNGANAADSASDGDRRWDIPFFAQSGAGNSAEIAVRFLESLKIPQGPSAGNPVTLAPFQKQFVTGAMADSIAAAVLSIGRGNAKTALSAGIALGALLGVSAAHVDREGRYNAHGRMAASAVCRVRHAAVLSGCFPPLATAWPSTRSALSRQSTSQLAAQQHSRNRSFDQ